MSQCPGSSVIDPDPVWPLLFPAEPIVVVRPVPEPALLCLVPNRDRYPDRVVAEPPALAAKAKVGDPESLDPESVALQLYGVDEPPKILWQFTQVQLESH